METYESVLLVKSEVFVFKIPPRSSNRGYRAADWNLQEPQWSGRMRLVSKGNQCSIKLEDKMTGQLFAECPIETYPGIAVEAVTDSSRYFVLRIQGENGRSAFIGIGFSDRSDSFDLNVALQDHFKWVKKSEEIEHEKAEPKPELDLKFKEGETIKINMKITKKDGGEGSKSALASKSRPSSGGVGLPPPPGGGVRIAPPPAATVPGKLTPVQSPSHQQYPLGSSATTPTSSTNPFSQTAPTTSPSSSSNSNWVQF